MQQYYFRIRFNQNFSFYQLIILLIEFILKNMLSDKQQQWDDQKPNSINNFTAVKQLKQKQLEASILHNRIRKLQANTEHNFKKFSNHQNKLDELAVIRQTALQDIQSTRKRRLIQEQAIKVKAQQNKIKKENHIDKIHQNLQHIVIKKIEKHSQVLGEKFKNEQQVSKQRSKRKQHNLQRKNNIALGEQQSKSRILEYMQRKNHSVHQNLQKQKQGYLRKNMKKDAQLQKLAKKQLELIKRQSQSQIAYKQMKNKLDTMLGKIRKDKKQRKQHFQTASHRKENLEPSSYET